MKDTFTLHIDEVKKIIVSEIEEEIYDEKWQNRAFELFTEDGKRILITMRGRDLKIKNIEGREA